MEKKLLLLALLRHEEMHGYQLSEMLPQEEALSVIPFSKANAYKLLRKMEADGWITHFEEQEGNRPKRRVYKITAAGEDAFQQLLRRVLAAYPQPELAHAVGFNFVEELLPEEARDLLEKRRGKLLARRQMMDDLPPQLVQDHPTLAYLQQFYAFELAWLDNMIAGLPAGKVGEPDKTQTENGGNK